jgi:hypothetical protein
MATDPSWLYSTIAQSSAAIVAIIGGFITASILRFSAEKESLIKQVKDKKSTLEEYKSKNIATTKLEVEIPILEERIKAFSYPPNLEWGLAVLLYLAVFGIWLPVIVIAGEYFSIYTKILTVFTFLLGIAGVFGYIVFQIRELRRK